MSLRSLFQIASRAAPLAILFAMGCDDSGPRVYTAQPYSPEGGCLGDYVPVGLVTGNDLSGSCDPVCLTISSQLYVSTVCQPLPPEAVVASDSPDCVGALSAVNAGLYCGSTGVSEAGDEASDPGTGDDKGTSAAEAGDDAVAADTVSNLMTDAPVVDGGVADAMVVDVGVTDATVADVAIADHATDASGAEADAGRSADTGTNHKPGVSAGGDP